MVTKDEFSVAFGTVASWWQFPTLLDLITIIHADWKFHTDSPGNPGKKLEEFPVLQSVEGRCTREEHLKDLDCNHDTIPRQPLGRIEYELHKKIYEFCEKGGVDFEHAFYHSSQKALWMKLRQKKVMNYERRLEIQDGIVEQFWNRWNNETDNWRQWVVSTRHQHRLGAACSCIVSNW